MNTAKPPQNKRSSPRHRVLKQGKIMTANNLSLIDCRVRDLSETGARLVCGEQSAIPRAFRLIMPAENIMRDVEVRWRKGQEIGVIFSGEPRPAPSRK